MGKKLDLSGLTADEAEHVLQVVQRDMKLREKEEQRLSELKQELEEEGSRCLLLSRRSCFNRRCCIRCCSPFTFLLNPGRRCRDCGYNVCKACSVYHQRDKAWLCSACQKSRLLKTQSLEWFYTNVKTRFKRFGSAKVLKTLYRKHLAERRALPELTGTESSAYEDSLCNEGSFCGSDSTFYRQTKEHSVAETITVALRVAEEAIDEAISKAEFDSASQVKQNEAHYLREHREELIEELSKTIVQKIISRRKTLTEMRAEYDQDWPLEDHTDLHHHHHQSDCSQASGSLKHGPDLWRSHSAFSLLDNDPSGLMKDASQTAAWRSVERLDNTGAYGGASSVLKSPDGNWIALQSAQLSRPSLLSKRKSLVFSALERESEVVSAYEGMDSDSGPEARRGARPGTPPPLEGRGGERFLGPDGSWRPSRAPLARFKRKVAPEGGRPSPSCRTSIIDVNFNVEGAKEERTGAGRPDAGRVRRSRKKRRSKRGSSSSTLECREKDGDSQHSSDAATPATVTSGATTPEPDLTGREAKQQQQPQGEEVTLKLHQLAGGTSDSSTGGGAAAEVGDVDEDGQGGESGQGREDSGEGDERPWGMEIDLNEGRAAEEEVDEEMKHRLYRLIEHSRLAYLSTDDDLDRDDPSEGEWEGDEEADTEVEKTGGLASKLCRLEEEVRANLFSSTEDELDKVGVTDEEKTGQEEEEEEEEALASKVCRLANQANATQFSSTEDELDRAGGGEEEAMEEKLWEQAEEHVEVDLAGLIGASQLLSSTEEEPDTVGEKEVDEEMNEGGSETEEAGGKVRGRRESFGDLDENMFYLREEIKTESCDGVVLQDESEAEEKRACLEERSPNEDGRMPEVQKCDEVLKKDVTKAKGQATQLETVVQAKRTEESMSSDETKVPQESGPDEQEGERREERTGRGGEEGPQTEGDSEEEDAEFDRIIRSMLSMTLEDMQMDAFKDEGAENGSTSREPEESQASELELVEVDNGESTNASEETGSGEKSSSESAVGGRPGGIVGERIGAEIHENKDTKEVDRDAPERMQVEMHQTLAAKQLERLEMDDEEQEERKVNEWKLGKETKEEDPDDVAPRGGLLSPEEIQNRYSVVSLRSITTEVLKVLNATEELLQEGGGGDGPRLHSNLLPPHTDPKKLDRQFCRLEESVYVAAGEVYGLEAELGDLEECARDICSATSDMELSYLEEQVASAAAKVQQSELQIGDISARIAALKSAGLNVDTQRSRFTKSKNIPALPVTVESSRQLRRRLPAPPVNEDTI
ncbi:rab effector MyRIP [Pungitius pungitius]|uniref:rab effector MyRIP n=1 Tax=Pungitius pungitius TaxID=134920 RepID=UPI002E11CF81